MANEAVYETIKSTILSYLPDARILLFGSHARGNSNTYSDYDLLVITPNAFTSKEKSNWGSSLHKAVVKAIHAPVDLLVYSEGEINEKQHLSGHIVRSAIMEGRIL